MLCPRAPPAQRTGLAAPVRPRGLRGRVAGPMLAQPALFGKYMLVELVAEGAEAEVYRALLRGPAELEQVVALKRRRAPLPATGGPAWRERARRVGELAH